VDAEPLRVHLGLLLEKGEPAPAAEREQIPVVVLRVLAVLEELLSAPAASSCSRERKS